jgi:hypothetical protein
MKTVPSRPRRWRPLGLLVAVGLAGCDPLMKGSTCSAVCGRGDCPRLEKGAIPELTGTHTRCINEMQELLAEADDLVIYEHEWLLGGRTLGPYGMFHLGQVLAKLDRLPFPVVLECSPDEHLNAERRKAIIDYLVTNNVPPVEAEQRVIVAFPLTEGPDGDEAVYAFDRGFRIGPASGYGSGYGRGFYGMGGYGGFYGTGGRLGAFGVLR